MTRKTRRNDSGDRGSEWTSPPVAVFWDQSLVWGLICLHTLRFLGVPYRVVSGEEIGSGLLDCYRVLIVPGGWASHKIRALGESGKAEVRRFLERGGSYIGFCGGAGLALSGTAALGLVPLERMPRSDRIPSASGAVWVRGVTGHPAWRDLPQNFPVSIWWPSQFAWQPLSRSLCIASYASPGPDFCVADLPVADLESQGFPWEEWERIYGINLNPQGILGHPAIMEVRLGKGTLVLSYPHLETPGDSWGNRLFLNMLVYLDRQSSRHYPLTDRHSAQPASPVRPADVETVSNIVALGETVNDLICFGERHLLWNWRRPWLLNWRRGIRGLEYGTLALMSKTLDENIRRIRLPEDLIEYWAKSTKSLNESVETFCHLARLLLMEEKLATQMGNLPKVGRVNAAVDQLRNRLFGDRMNHGGLCRSILDELDQMLFSLFRVDQSHVVGDGFIEDSGPLSGLHSLKGQRLDMDLEKDRKEEE